MKTKSRIADRENLIKEKAISIGKSKRLLINKEKAILIWLDSCFSTRIFFFHSLFSLFCLFFELVVLTLIRSSWFLHRFICSSHPQVYFFVLFFSAHLYLRFLHAPFWVNWQGWIILDKDNGELFQLYSCFLRTSRIF